MRHGSGGALGGRQSGVMRVLCEGRRKWRNMHPGMGLRVWWAEDPRDGTRRDAYIRDPRNVTGETRAVAAESRNTIEFWREEVLRRAEQALQGRLVALFEATPKTVAPVTIGSNRSLPLTASAEINGAVRRWSVAVPVGSRLLAARLDMGRWCIASVRSDIPNPPPRGIERRRKERMTLELAGIALGLLEERFAREAARECARGGREAVGDTLAPSP